MTSSDSAKRTHRAQAAPARQPFAGRQNEMGRGWGRLRTRQLRREPMCEWTEDGARCVEQAEVVDHIIPRFEGGTDDPSNLQSLCQGHSDVKTSAEGHRAWLAHVNSTKAKWDRRERHPGAL